MKLTGQKLKEKRETARLTISEVSLATKINPKVLHAMECGDIEHLPARTFLRGFVRAYAGFLKMNVAEVLELFNQEHSDAAQKEIIEAPVVEAKKDASSKRVDVNGEGSGTFRMFIIGGILVLIVMIIGVRSVVQKYERERNVDTTTDLSASKVIPLEEKKPELPPETPADATAPAVVTGSGTVTVVPPAVEVKSESVKIEPVKVEPPKPEVKPEVAKVEPPKPTEPAKAEPIKVEPAKEEKPAPKVADGQHHEIILEALDKVEVAYRLHGESKKIPMTTGQVHTIVTDEPVSFDVSDGGALNITDNGHDKGPAGDLGHRKQVSVP